MRTSSVNPKFPFFRSNYKRHTNFAQTVERQVIQGNPSTGGMSTVRFERKGDMLGYVYVSSRANGKIFTELGRMYVSKVELLIGGQVIDTQESEFMTDLAPVVMNQTLTRNKPMGLRAAAHIITHSGFRFAKTPNPRSHWSRFSTTMLN